MNLTFKISEVLNTNQKQCFHSYSTYYWKYCNFYRRYVFFMHISAIKIKSHLLEYLENVYREYEC